MKKYIKVLLIFFCLNGYQNIAAMEENQPESTPLERVIRGIRDPRVRRFLTGIQEENDNEIETSVQDLINGHYQNPVSMCFPINDTKSTALYLAIISNKPNGVKKLLELGASPTESCCWRKTCVPLTIALRQDKVNAAIVRSLIEHEADPEAIGEYGKNSLEIAREKGLLHLFANSITKKSAAKRD